jgi:hypothetical protein
MNLAQRIGEREMRDYYQDGFDAGYGKPPGGHNDFPQTDGDAWSYRRGVEDGQRRRRISDELDREHSRYDD